MLEGLISFGTSIFNNQQAEQREKLARLENYRYGEKAANNADRRTRNLYQDLQSPEALLQQYKAAGLSPSLMFSGGGAGGGVTAGAQGQGASGISPTTYGAGGNVSPLEAAQTALTLAQTEKTKAETETENETREPKIQNILQDTSLKLSQSGLNKSAQALNEANTRLTTVNALLNEEAYADNLDIIKYNASIAASESKKALYEAGKAEIDFTIANETQKEQIQQIKNNTVEQLKRIANLIKDTELKEAYIKEIESGIAQRWDEITTQKWNAYTYEHRVNEEIKYWLRLTDNYKEGLDVEMRGQDMKMYQTIIDAGTAVLQSGMNTAGTVYMADTYKTVGGKPTYTTTRTYNGKGQFMGQRETLTRHK